MRRMRSASEEVTANQMTNTKLYMTPNNNGGDGDANEAGQVPGKGKAEKEGEGERRAKEGRAEEEAEEDLEVLPGGKGKQERETVQRPRVGPQLVCHRGLTLGVHLIFLPPTPK